MGAIFSRIPLGGIGKIEILLKRDGGNMRFEAVEIRRDALYNFIVETRAKPDNALRETIREQIREAMEALERTPESYSISIIQGREEDTRERQFPTLEPGKDYLLFAIVDNGNDKESPSNRELEEQRGELARGIFPPDKSRVALVLLYDSLVGVVITKKLIIASISHQIAKTTPSRRSY